MSQKLIARSKDLLTLRNEGFHVVVRNGYLFVKDVPYVTSSCAVREDGILVSELETQVVDGHEVTSKPTKHVAYWIGEHPSHANGAKITSFENPSTPPDFGSDLKGNFVFSAKAPYRDYEHKVRAYLGWIVGEAQKLRPEVTAQTHPVYESDAEDDSVFHYIDTASSRVHINADNEKLQSQRVAIVGVGGTGSYVLDLIAKTMVAEIHLFDGDTFHPHNAFRAPGAWSLAELQQKKSKVDNLVDIYSKLRRKGLFRHEALNKQNLHLLEGMTFVFLCFDQGGTKRAAVDFLTERGIPFINVGMGIIRTPTGLQGVVQVATATAQKQDHIARKVSFGTDDDEPENEYATNIQVAELNALNAAFAVIRWKRLFGFYRDAGREFFNSYQIATGELSNEDVLE